MSPFLPRLKCPLLIVSFGPTLLINLSKLSKSELIPAVGPVGTVKKPSVVGEAVRSAVGCSEKMLRREYLKKPEEEIGSAMRRSANSTASSASKVPLLQQPQRHCSRSAESSDTKNSDWQERLWALHVRRYLPFVLRSPAQYWQCPRCRISGSGSYSCRFWSCDTKFARNPYWRRPRRAGGTPQ
jgi:hypothetical protein